MICSVPRNRVISEASRPYFGWYEKDTLTYEESTMAAQPKDSSKPDKQPEKKKAETVQLSAEELKKIAGGGKTPPGPPLPGDLHKFPPK
jgi:hypothetical protein